MFQKMETKRALVVATASLFYQLLDKDFDRPHLSYS